MIIYLFGDAAKVILKKKNILRGLNIVLKSCCQIEVIKFKYTNANILKPLFCHP